MTAHSSLKVHSKMESVQIHPTAIVHSEAELAPGVQVGPYSIIEKNVRIGEGTQVGARVTLEGYTTLGKNNQIFTGAVIGSITQDKKYKGGRSFLKIGDNNKIREYVTMNPGTEEGSETSVGNDNLIMAYTHVAHDCDLGSHIVMANAANLAGHISIGNHAVIGGLVGVHQYVRIGEYAMVGGCSALGKDVPPYVRAAGGYRAQMFGINIIALRRHGFSVDLINTLKSAYLLLFRQGHRLQESIKLARNEYGESTAVMSLLTFLESTSRGICQVSSRELDDEEE